MRNLRTLLICLPVCLVLVSGGAVYAQRDTGTIVGTVSDQSGAVVPGVTVTIRNVETNAVFSTVSDATGNYAAPLLKPGPYEVVAELPGLDQNDVALELSDGVLTISGEKKSETEDKQRFFSERYYGRFERRIPVDDVDQEKVAASFKNGVLTVTLPKLPTAQRKVKRIAINGK